MKKIIFLFAALSCLLLSFAGCEENKEQPKFEITKGETEYGAQGGTGSIKTGGLPISKVESDKDWCRVSFSGQDITIGVDPNGNISERTAKVMITPQDGARPVYAHILQDGSKFIIDPDGKSSFSYADGVYSAFFSLTGGDIELEYYSDLDFNVEINTPGLDYTEQDGKLLFTIQPASKPRNLKAVVSATFENGATSSSTIEIKQSLAYEELLGDWEMSYYNNSITSPVKSTIKVTLTENIPGVSYTLSGLPVYVSRNIYADLNVLYTASDGSFTIPNGQYLCEFLDSSNRTNYVHLSALRVTNTSGTSYGYSYHYGTHISLKFDYDLESEDIKLVMGNNGSWSGANPDGFVTYGYRTTPPQAYNPYYWWTQFFYPEFVKK